MSVNIALEKDEALVLFELLASQKLDNAVDAAERNALWALEGVLQKVLVELLASNYADIIKGARESLLSRYGSSN